MDNNNYNDENEKLINTGDETNLDDVEELLDNEETIEVLNDENEVQYLENNNRPPIQRGQRFGEREYNAAKDKNGIYNRDYYKNKREESEKKVADAEKERNNDKKLNPNYKENSNQEGNEQNSKDNNEQEPKYINKNWRDKTKDNANLAKSKINNYQNKIDDVKNKVYQMQNPKDVIKDKAKTAAKNKAKAAIKKAEAFVLGASKKKRILIIGAVVIIFLFLIILMMLFFGTPTSAESPDGYYDSACNFNETVIYCSENTSISLEEYVIDLTYNYIKDNDYSDAEKKALMVILKTNLLSNNNYNSSTKSIEMINCELNNDKDEKSINNLKELYSEIENDLYVSESFKGNNITSLSPANALSFNDEINNNLINSNKGDYIKILDSLYNTDVSSTKYSIYNMTENCTYFSLADNNDYYWWPIGSSEPTSDTIYGGTPTATRISSPYGYRTLGGKRKLHEGIDIAGGCSVNKIIASRSGTVVRSSDGCPTQGKLGSKCGNGGYGNWVMIDHGDGTSTVYGHMAQNSIVYSVGETVKQGQIIGLMGSSGNSTGCHLHFEVRINSKKVNPSLYVSATDPRPGLKKIQAVSGTSDKKSVCKSFLASGYNKNATAGIMINIQKESGFKTNNLQNSYEAKLGYNDITYTNAIDNGKYSRSKFMNDKAGYGLVQWTASDRKAGLYDAAKSKSKSISDLGVQLEYLDKELEENKNYKTIKQYLKDNTVSASAIALEFCLKFEKPANKNFECRDRVNKYLNEMQTYVNNNCN